MKDNMVLLIGDSAGIYIPKEFIESTKDVDGWNYGVSEEDIKTLKNPDDEWYWDAWDNVLNNAVFTDKDGKEYSLHQDGDLWAICYESMTEEEKDNFELND